MATIHPIKNCAAIIAELEIATGKMAVVTNCGVVLLNIPAFRKKKKAQPKKTINVEVPDSIAFIKLAKFAASEGCRLEFNRETGNARFVALGVSEK